MYETSMEFSVALLGVKRKAHVSFPETPGKRPKGAQRSQEAKD